MKSEVRIDKWLWAVRLFKTRSLAAEACKKGKILIHGQPVKASHSIRIGDVVGVKRNPVLFSYQVLALTENRLNAKLLPEYLLDVTTPDQRELFELGKLNNSGRIRGSGRPTKKERRDLEDFIEPFFLDDDEDGWEDL